VKKFHAKHKHAKRLLRKHNITVNDMRHGATKAAAGAALAGSLFVAPAHSQTPKPVPDPKDHSVVLAQVPAPPTTSVQPQGPENPAPKKMTQDEFAQKIQDIMANSTQREGRLSDEQMQQIKINKY